MSPLTYQLQAVGLNARGQIVITDGFDWSTTNTLLDHRGDGLFVATMGSGEVAVTATYAGSDQAVVSDAVTFVILPSAPEGVSSVRVVDPIGQPVAGAQVVSGVTQIQTNAEGIADFGAQPIGDLVTVFADGFDYMSVVRADCDEVLVPLSYRTDLTQSVGLEGVVSFDNLVGDGELETSLTGSAVTGGILGLSLERLIGVHLLRTRISFWPQRRLALARWRGCSFSCTCTCWTVISSMPF